MSRLEPPTERLSPEEIASTSLLPSDPEKRIYTQILKWDIQRDKKLGITSYFSRNPDGALAYCRDATQQESLHDFSNQLIEKEQWGSVALNYSLGLRRLIKLSEHTPEKKERISQQLEKIEANYIKINNALADEQSPDLLRQSFVYDLAALLIQQTFCIAGQKIKTFEHALGVLDRAKDRTRPLLAAYRVETSKALSLKGKKIGTYKRIETPITHFSVAYLDTLQQCTSKEQPLWFRLLPQLDQLFILDDIPACQKGCVLPSQAREKPGMKNVFVTEVFFKKEGAPSFEKLSHHAHAATSVPMIKGLNHEDTLALTKLAINNIRESLFCDQLSIGTLVSQKGDRTLNLVDEMNHRPPGKYYDAKAYQLTKQSESEKITAFNTCLNIFRYGEPDDIAGLIKHISDTLTQLEAISNPPEELASLIQITKDYAEEALLLAKAIDARVKKANKAINRNLTLPAVVESVVKTKLRGVRKKVRDKFNRYSLRRMAATKINKKKNKRDLHSIDGDLKAIRFIWLYTRTINSISLLKKQQHLFKKDDRSIAEHLQKIDIVFGCMSGNNRTQHVSHLMAYFSIMETLTTPDMSEEHFQELSHDVLTQMTEDFSAQTITALGGTPGCAGFRAKSKDSTSTHYKDNSHAASLLYLPFSDSKAMDRTLLKIREWLFTCKMKIKKKDTISAFQEAIASIEQTIRASTSPSSMDVVFTEKKALPKSFQKQLAIIRNECLKGVFANLVVNRHPDWFLLQQQITLIAIRQSAEEMAENAIQLLTDKQKEELALPPIPKVTDAMADRDDLIRIITGKLYYLTLNEKYSGHEHIDSLKTSIAQLQTTYRQYRYSDLDTLKSALKDPLINSLKTWEAITSKKKAFRVFYRLCFSLGYATRIDRSYKTNHVEAEHDIKCLSHWLNTIERTSPAKRRPTASTILAASLPDTPTVSPQKPAKVKGKTHTQKEEQQKPLEKVQQLALTPQKKPPKSVKTKNKKEDRRFVVSPPAYAAAFCFLATIAYMAGTGVTLSSMNLTKSFISWFSGNQTFACLFVATCICLLMTGFFTAVAYQHKKKKTVPTFRSDPRFLRGGAQTTTHSKLKTCTLNPDQGPKKNTT